MSCCVKIYLREIPVNVPESIKDSKGNVKFELSTDFAISKTKKLSQLTDFQNIGTDGVLGFNIPRTDNNSFLINTYGRPTAFNFDHRKVIPVIVFDGAKVFEEDYIRILRVSESGWEVELFRGSDYWKESLESVRLCELTFDNFILRTDNLLANWDAEIGDVEYRFPLIDYGNWSNAAVFSGGDPLNVVTAGQAENEDFRPWFHVFYVLEKAFCAIGWKFRSPILESDFGLRLIAYILSDFDIPSQNYSFKAVVTDRHFGGVGAPLFNSPDYSMITDAIRAYDDFNLGYDNGGTPGFYRPSATFQPGCSAASGAGYFFTRGLSGTFRFRFRVTINTSFDQTDRLLQFKVKQRGGLNPTFATTYFRVYADQTQTFEHTITLDILPGNCYEFWIDEIIESPGAPASTVIYSSLSGNGYWEVLEGSEVWVEPVKIRFADGMLIVPQTLINCKYTADKFLAGVMHLFGSGLLQTDLIDKTVTLFHRDDVIFGLGLRPESYFKKETEALELNAVLECKSSESILKTGLEDRYLNLRYKKSDDKFVELSGYGDENQPQQKSLDFGANNGFKETIKTDENPFFEPTLMRICDSLESPSGYGNVIIPVAWDNDEGKISYNINPRILLWGGTIEQPGQLSGSDYIPRSWYWSTPDFESNFIPFSYSQYSDQIGIINPQKVPYNLAYGDFPDFPADLYTVFWRLALAERFKSFQILVKAILYSSQYNELSFRNLYYIAYNGDVFLAKLIEISNYNVCTGNANLVMQPVLYNETDVCISSN